MHMEEVWIKTEPIEVESSASLDIKCEDGINVVETGLSTEINSFNAEEVSLQNVSIKSEITLGDYEFNPKSEEIKLTENKTNEKNFNCSECGAKFNLKWRLTQHQLKHTGKRPFGCDICGKTFYRRGCRDRHIRMHTGEKQHACDICGMRFAQKCHIKSHKRKHTGEKPFSCNYCGTKFMYKYSMKLHIKTHFPTNQDQSLSIKYKIIRQSPEKVYPCGICDKIFKRRDGFTRHFRTHTGERPYSCDICGLNFTQSGHLTAHKRIHTGEKTYSCSVCRLEFMYKQSLRKHKQKCK